MASNYGRRMARLSAQIFGEVVRKTSDKSQKVVKLFSELPANLDPDVVKYYPRYKEINGLMKKLRKLGLYRNEYLDFVEEYKKQRILRGKGPPAKGQGKRATKALAK